MVKNVLNTLRKKQKNNKGFSLVELIVVIAIMAVLIGVLAPQFIKYVERSRQSTDLQNVEELKNAVEVAVADEGITKEECDFVFCRILWTHHHLIRIKHILYILVTP